MAAGVELGTRATMAATLTFERRKSLADQVADTLVEAIGLGLLQPGERMVETEIAARFSVSRVPVREALKILATQGILQGEPHRGLYVIEVDDVVLDQICEARVAVETLAVRALMAEPERLARLAEVLQTKIAVMAARIRANDLVAINHADIDFHRQLCAISGNGIATTLWQALARHIWIVFGREIQGETAIAQMVGQHEDLARAITTGTESQAIAELERHILRRRSRPRPAA